jgi:hypothetical protein
VVDVAVLLDKSVCPGHPSLESMRAGNVRDGSAEILLPRLTQTSAGAVEVVIRERGGRAGIPREACRDLCDGNVRRRNALGAREAERDVQDGESGVEEQLIRLYPAPSALGHVCPFEIHVERRFRRGIRADALVADAVVAIISKVA